MRHRVSLDWNALCCGHGGNRTPITVRRRAPQVQQLWRAPEGPEGQAAVPVGGGGAWPGFETTRRAELAARTASGRAAAHGRTKQPGPTAHHAAPGTPVGPHATPSMRRAAAHRHTQRPGPPAPGTPAGPQASTHNAKPPGPIGTRRHTRQATAVRSRGSSNAPGGAVAAVCDGDAGGGEAVA